MALSLLRSVLRGGGGAVWIRPRYTRRPLSRRYQLGITEEFEVHRVAQARIAA